MTQQHPIVPPPELVQQWRERLFSCLDPAATVAVHELSCLATQWGADQELEACCEWLDRNCPSVGAHHLRTERRPKPPSLKEQALDELDGIAAVFRMSHGGDLVCDKIRRALEQLDD